MSKETLSLLNSQMDAYEQKVFKDLLSSHNINTAQFKQVVLTEIKKNPKMMDAFVKNPSSLFASIIFCAQLGLMPSDTLGEFYFVPFKDAIKPIIGYQGIVTILLRSGLVKSISAEIVCEGDDFEYELGLEPKLIHRPKDPIRNAFTLTYVYVVATLSNGSKQFKVMSKAELQSHIDSGKNPNDLYWNQKKDPNLWMVKKIVLKQLAKLLPKDYVGKMAVKYDDAVEGGKILSLDEDNQIVVEEQKVASIYDNLIDTM
jgi:recombination protein RecT